MTEPNKIARKALWLLWGIALLNYIDRQIVAAVVPSIRQQFFAPGAPPQHGFVAWMLHLLQPFLGSKPENAMIGLLAMAFMLTFTLVTPLAGALKVRRWWVVSGAVAVWSLASGGSGLASTFAILLLMRCLVGVGEAAFGPTAPAIISDYFDKEGRGRALAFYSVAIPVGSALGFVIGGQLGQHWGWRSPFFATVIPGLVVAAICLFLPDPQRVSQYAAQAAVNKLTVYKGLVANRSFMLVTLGMTAMTFAMGGIAFWMPSYIQEYRQVGTLSQVNTIFGGMLVLAGLTATPLGGYLADRLQSRIKGAYFVVSGVGMLFALPCFIASLYLSFPLAWICLFFACFGLFISMGPTNAIVANVTNSPTRQVAFALNIFIVHALGDVISPLVVGAVTDASGNDMTKAFLVVSLVVALGGLFWLLGARRLDKDVAAASAAEPAETALAAG